MRNFICLCIFVTLLSGCATISPTPEKSIEKTRMYEVSFDELWKVMIQSLTASGESISVAQKDSGLVVFQKSVACNTLTKITLGPPGVVCFMPTLPFATINIVAIKSDDAHTDVTIGAKVIGRFRKNFSNFFSTELPSNGVLEKEYLDKIEAALKKQSN